MCWCRHRLLIMCRGSTLACRSCAFAQQFYLHFIHTCMHTGLPVYMHTLFTHTHTHTHSPRQLLYTQSLNTHLRTQNLYKAPGYTHSCSTPLCPPQHFHTRLYHTQHFYTPFHTLISPTKLLHITFRTPHFDMHFLHTHRSSTISSCLFPAFSIPSSHFFDYLLEKIDM